MTDKPKLDEDRIKEFKQYFERWNENLFDEKVEEVTQYIDCLLYTSPSPRDVEESRMPSSA